MTGETRITALGCQVVMRATVGAEPAVVTFSPTEARAAAAGLLLAAETAEGRACRGCGSNPVLAVAGQTLCGECSEQDAPRPA